MKTFTRGTRPKTTDQIINEITKLIPRIEVTAEVAEGFIEIKIKDFAKLPALKQTAIRNKLVALEKFLET